VTRREEISASFDGIFSNNVIEHFRDPVAQFEEFRRVLKPGGVMAHSSPCYEYAYSCTRFHTLFLLKQRGIRAVIPPKSNRTKTISYSKRLYRQRNCIERVLGHLKINRAIATRYDQLADSFLGMLYLATARYWIKFVHAA
jgi:ubiquinone/menaquinone biosynthesis C-methylase UbiE